MRNLRSAHAYLIGCYHHVSSLGTGPMQTAFDFRRVAYGWMRTPVPAQPPKRVLVLLRGDPPARRAIVNVQAMLAVMDFYKIQYTVVKGIPGSTFKDQFDL